MISPSPAAERAALRRVIDLLDLDGRRLAGAVLAGSAGLGSAVGLAAVSAWLIARASQMPPVLDLSVAVVAVRAFGISRAVFRYIERLASHDVALRGLTALRERVYNALAAGRTDAVVALRRGDLLARMGADVDAVGDFVVRAVLPCAVTAVVGLATVVLVGALLPGAALVLLITLLLAGVASPALTARAVRIAELSALAERAELSAAAQSGVECAAELRVSGRAPSLVAVIRAADSRLARATDRAARPASAAAAVNVGAMGLAVLGALLLGIPATTAGLLAPVELAVVVLVPLAAFEATAMLPAAATQYVRSAGAAARIVDLIDAATPPQEPASEGSDRPSRASGQVAISVEDGAVSAENLTCAWPGGEPVLTGLDLAVAPGRSVAVVGPSGVGKSTLLYTLAGLIPAAGGTVRVAGRDPWLEARSTVSRAVVLTAEDAHVFDTTVLENLRVARGDVTPDDARRALRAAGLGPWLAALPQGLDTRLGADASTISGGERRRLLLARALLSPAPILLLDEPAEHLDARTADALVTDLLESASRAGRGIVLVTHRLSALGGADEVVVLGTGAVPDANDDGARSPTAGAERAPGSPGSTPAHVVARGTHEELRAASPAYAWALAQEHTGSEESLVPHVDGRPPAGEPRSDPPDDR